MSKSLESFDKRSADKIWSKNDKEIKVSPLMPIRVKQIFKNSNLNFNGEFSGDDVSSSRATHYHFGSKTIAD